MFQHISVLRIKLGSPYSFQFEFTGHRRIDGYTAFQQVIVVLDLLLGGLPFEHCFLDGLVLQLLVINIRLELDLASVFLGCDVIGVLYGKLKDDNQGRRGQHLDPDEV